RRQRDLLLLRLSPNLTAQLRPPLPNPTKAQRQDRRQRVLLRLCPPLLNPTKAQRQDRRQRDLLLLRLSPNLTAQRKYRQPWQGSRPLPNPASR
ncbi:hypothetical protein, partial [Chloroflexus sp.]|uniref:hypothetical protein n=1 Tax=Chloroflexus sp. TaxID=1904827 RepID=UPI002FD96D67